MKRILQTVTRGRGGEAVVILAGRALGAIGGILTTRVATELMLPEQLGAVAQMLAVAGFFRMVVATPVVYYVLRGLLEWRAEGVLARCLRRYGGFLLGVSVVATVIAGTVQRAWGVVVGFTPGWVAALVALYLVSYAGSTLGTTGLNILNRRVWFVVFNNAPIWAGLALGILFFQRQPGATTWSLGQYLGFAIACLSLPLLLRAGREGAAPAAGRPVTPGTIPAMLRFAVPGAALASLSWMQYQSYRFVMEPISGAASVGLFAVGYGIAANVVGTFEVVFNQFYETLFFTDLKGAGREGQTRAWDRFARVYLPGLVLVAALTISGAPFLARIMVAERFRSTTAQLVAWCGVVEALRAAGAVGHHLSIARVDMRLFITSALAGAVLAPAGVIVFAPGYPLLGTAVGLLISSAVAFALVVRQSRAALPVTWPIRSTLLAAFASLPLVAALEWIRWFRPQPGPLLSLAALGMGALYVLAVQVRFFASSPRDEAVLSPES